MPGGPSRSHDPLGRTAIRERKTFQLNSLMQTGTKQGMRTLNTSLFELVNAGVVEPAEAMLRSTGKEELRQLLEREGLGSGEGGL